MLFMGGTWIMRSYSDQGNGALTADPIVPVEPVVAEVWQSEADGEGPQVGWANVFCADRADSADSDEQFEGFEEEDDMDEGDDYELENDDDFDDDTDLDDDLDEDLFDDDDDDDDLEDDFDDD